MEGVLLPRMNNLSDRFISAPILLQILHKYFVVLDKIQLS